MTKDLSYERESQPFWSCVVRPGDWLYIPTGWWHSARGVEGDSITLACTKVVTPSWRPAEKRTSRAIGEERPLSKKTLAVGKLPPVIA